MNVVVIGGGIAGLAASYFLLNENAQAPATTPGKKLKLTLLEATERLGGVISTTNFDGAVIEEGPDSIITTKPWAISLIHSLGLSNQIIETNPTNRRALVALNGRLHPVPPGFFMMAPGQIIPFLFSSLFTPAGKLRMLMDLLIEPGPDIDDESVASFVRRRLGQEALDRVAQPLLAGIYTANPAALSLRATMPQFLDWERKHGSIIIGLQQQSKHGPDSNSSGARYSMFATLREGMSTLVNALASHIRTYADIRCGVQVEQIYQHQERWHIRLANNEILDADAVVCASPSHITATLVRKDSPKLATLLSGIPRASSAVINLVYRRSDVKHSLNGFGFVVPAKEKRSIIACSFSSVKFPGRAPNDMVALRIFAGGAMQNNVYCLPDNRLQQLAIADVRDYLGINGQPVWSSFKRFPDSMPQYQVHHAKVIAQIDTLLNGLPGLFLAGNAVSGVGIPDCIHSGELAATKLVEFLRARSVS